MTDKEFTEAETAEKVGVDPSTLKQWRRFGKVPYGKRGLTVFYTQAHIDAIKGNPAK